MTQETNETRDDVDWLAFCYVAGELSELELSNFEKRLATDPLAREAVASAMALSELVYEAEVSNSSVGHPELVAKSNPSLQEQFAKSKPSLTLVHRWAFAAAAGFALLAIGWAVFGNAFNNQSEFEDGLVSVSTETIAVAWADSLDAFEMVETGFVIGSEADSIPLEGDTSDTTFSEIPWDDDLGDSADWMVEVFDSASESEAEGEE